LGFTHPKDTPLPLLCQSTTSEYTSWSPSPYGGTVGCNVYRASGPVNDYQQIVTNTTSLSYADPYDFSKPVIAYAVTALDGDGRQSGFSNFLYAFRLVNPAAIAMDGSNRIVLDPQNGYALLYQLSDGAFVDTRSSYDYHLEYSYYLVRDRQGRLIVSHPGDYYTGRHSVRVFDQNYTLAWEFGETGSGTGQFQGPAGVAVWGSPCTFGGPYSADAHTLLLLHLDGDYTGAQGEIAAPSSTSFEAGQYGQGVLIDSGDTLTYPTAGNLQLEQGAIEFWIKTQWAGNDGQHHYLFSASNSYWSRIELVKDGANDLKFEIYDGATGYGAAFNVSGWTANTWHHVAATWQPNDMRLCVDGAVVGSNTSASMMLNLPSVMYIGSNNQGYDQADAVIDELRISDIARLETWPKSWSSR